MGHTGTGPTGTSNRSEWHMMAARCRLCGERTITETDCNVCEECIEQSRKLQAENERLQKRNSELRAVVEKTGTGQWSIVSFKAWYEIHGKNLGGG